MASRTGARQPRRRDRAARSAARLCRWYPKAWRARYGTEFTELLVADLAERPRSWRRAADVAYSGLLARCAGAGLRENPLDPPDQERASLATLCCAVAVFLAFAAAMWSQLTVGWRWVAPDSAAVPPAVALMSVAGLLLVAVLACGAVPAGFAVLQRVVRKDAKGLGRPAAAIAASIVILIAGGRHYAHHWPGTGGHPWAAQALIPRGPAAFTWASTLSVTSYWAHPHALLRFPAGEIAWMMISPVAIVCLVAAAAVIVRRLDLPPAAMRFEATLARAAAFGMIGFAAGAFIWIAGDHSGPRNMFHPGAIDAADLMIMLLALAVVQRAIRHLRPSARC